jgi:hypothetical protein
MGRALLFDLDETLIVDERVTVETFEATARVAAECCEVDAGRLGKCSGQHRTTPTAGGSA